MPDDKKTILIVDDTAVNRAILMDILSDDYNIIEASNGREAIEMLKKYDNSIELLLLDIIMPEVDGYDVLSFMKKSDMLEYVPVIIISVETSAESIVKGFEYGAVDFVGRPFDPDIVKKRVRNTIMLYTKQNQLRGMVAEQIRKKEQSYTIMTDILSTVVEVRNGESGLHVKRVRQVTEILLEEVRKKYPKYGLTEQIISVISNAAGLHDIGKIVIPESILNKPGRLTAEEMDIMRTHTVAADDMLKAIDNGSQEEELVKYAREICRWHHERWDGRGYPDGLVGEQNPIAAQAVGVADVYDALVSERVYKPMFSHAQAVQMIRNGECGVFNPDLMDCFLSIENKMEESIRIRDNNHGELFDINEISNEVMNRADTTYVDRTRYLLDRERGKTRFFYETSEEMLFDYDVSTDTISVSTSMQIEFGFPHIISDFSQQIESRSAILKSEFRRLINRINKATPDNPTILMNLQINTLSRGEQWFEVLGRSMWLLDDNEETHMHSIIGKVRNISAPENAKFTEERSMHDALTKLYTKETALKKITTALNEDGNENAALLVLEIKGFEEKIKMHEKHYYEQILLDTSTILEKNVRNYDILARTGGNEFLVFLRKVEDANDLTAKCEIIITACERRGIYVSMGAAIFPDHGGDFESLLLHANQALDASKEQDGRQLAIYKSEQFRTKPESSQDE